MKTKLRVRVKEDAKSNVCAAARALESTKEGDGDIDTTPLDVCKVAEEEEDADPLDWSFDLPDRAAAGPLDLLERYVYNLYFLTYISSRNYRLDLWYFWQ